MKIENVKVKCLLRWPPGESDALSALVLQMKNESVASWSIWAQEFIGLWSEDLSKDSIFVSSESISGKQHSQNWAKALSQSLSCDAVCALKPSGGVATQRGLTRVERTQKVFDLNVDFSNSRDKRIIFADDVVTTGQTALAAYKALKEPSDFEVWCLIYREL